MTERLSLSGQSDERMRGFDAAKTAIEPTVSRPRVRGMLPWTDEHRLPGRPASRGPAHVLTIGAVSGEMEPSCPAQAAIRAVGPLLAVGSRWWARSS